MTRRFRRRAVRGLLFLAGVVVGVVGYQAAARWLFPAPEHKEIRVAGFRYISPLLECDTEPTSTVNRELVPFRSLVEDAVRRIEAGGTGLRLAVYFRDMNNGPWFAVGEGEDFLPASLLKVPVMISVLKAAERDPSLLGRRFLADLDRDMNGMQYFRPPRPIQLGRTYTAEELVESLVAQSDNNANLMLLGITGPEAFDTTMRDLGITAHGHPSPAGYVSVVGYSSFFRVLYNASYLGREMSEKGLGMLARSSFRRGLVAGVPEGVEVAHKFGEARAPDGALQLHDCGIVYYPAHPYLLCVMSRGGSFESLASAITQVSGIVYREVHRQHTAH